MLTPKQEKFVQNLIKGMSQREAYRNAYPNDTSSDSTVDKNASNLLNNNSKVLGRYKELLEKAEKNTIMSSKKRKEWLTNVINGIEKEKVTFDKDNGEKETLTKEADLNTKIRALDILNKMEHEYVTKIEGDLSVVKLEDVL